MGGLLGGGVAGGAQDGDSIWNAAAGFGRQLMQDLGEGPQSQPPTRGAARSPAVATLAVAAVPGGNGELRPAEASAVAADAVSLTPHVVSEANVAPVAGQDCEGLASPPSAAANTEQPTLEGSGDSPSEAPPAAAAEPPPSEEATELDIAAHPSLVEAHFIGDSEGEGEAESGEVQNDVESQSGARSPLASQDWLDPPAQAPEVLEPGVPEVLDALALEDGRALREALDRARAQLAKQGKEHKATEERLLQEQQELEEQLRVALDLCKLQVREADSHAQRASSAPDQLRELRAAAAAEREKLTAALQKSQNAERRLLGEVKDMETELFAAQERWQEQVRTAERAAEQARADRNSLGKEAAQRVKALDAEKGRLEALLQEAARAENRLRKENEDMEKEMHEHQENWKKQIRTAVQQEKQALAECERLQKELDSHEAERSRASAGEDEQRRKVDADLVLLRGECDRRLEELRAAAEVESQLRRELASADHGRLQLEDQVASLTLQLERAQAAYVDAVREVGAMASQLRELEFGSQHKANSEELMRSELTTARERIVDLEKQLKEVAYLRDCALERADEARVAALKLREDVARADADREATASAAAEASAEAAQAAVAKAAGRAAVSAAAAADGDSSSVADATVPSTASLSVLRAEHGEELKRLAQVHREEVDYLRRRSDEKDRRLETLICDRNALRLENAEHSTAAAVQKGTPGKKKEAEVDLEDGLTLRTPGVGGSGFAGAASDCARDGDVVLRRFSKLLFVSRTLRGAFFTYLVVVHIWIWVILHHTASTRTSGGA